MNFTINESMIMLKGNIPDCMVDCMEYCKPVTYESVWMVGAAAMCFYTSFMFREYDEWMTDFITEEQQKLLFKAGFYSGFLMLLMFFVRVWLVTHQ